MSISNFEKDNSKPSQRVKSISDIIENDLNGLPITGEERTALSNFQNYRLSVLKKEEDMKNFGKKYRQLQVIANLSEFSEFLKEEYIRKN